MKRVLQEVDEVSDFQFPTGWLEERIDKSDKDELRIPVAAIRSRYAQDAQV